MTVANANETIEPTSGFEALEDTARFMTTFMPRREVIEMIREMGPTRILQSVAGHIVDPPLSPVEAQLAITVDHYRDMMGSPVGAVALLEGLRQEVLDGGVFVGQPTPDSFYSAQA